MFLILNYKCLDSLYVHNKNVRGERISIIIMGTDLVYTNPFFLGNDQFMTSV